MYSDQLSTQEHTYPLNLLCTPLEYDGPRLALEVALEFLFFPKDKKPRERLGVIHVLQTYSSISNRLFLLNVRFILTEPFTYTKLEHDGTLD